jgi:signal transduction histidine kinase
MNGFSIAGLFFVAIPSIIIGPFVLLKGRSKVHLTWAAFLTSVALWGFGMFKIGESTNPESAFFWWRIAEIGVILIPVFLVHFVINFLNLKRTVLLSIFYLTVFLLLYLNLFTSYFIHDLYFAFNQFYYISATLIYSLFICLFVISIIYSIFELNRQYEKSNGIKRAQIKYLILAFFLGFSGGLTSYPPVYGIQEIYPFWNSTIFISALMISYAILRYRLMDIRIFVRKVVFFGGMAGIVYGSFYLTTWFYDIFLGGTYSAKTYVAGLVVAPLFVGVFVLANKLLKNFTNKYLFFSLYNYQETITKLASELDDSIDLNKIVNLIVNTIKDTMQLDKAGVLLINKERGLNKYKIAKVIGFDETNGISLVQDNFLTKYLQKIQKPLVKEELGILAKDMGGLEGKQSFENLEKNMEKIEASLCLPLINANKLTGIIVLGSKVSGDAYSNEDLNLLDTLSKQASIALENARLYKEVQEFSKTLQQKVDEQTKEIRKAYEVEKEARKSLENMNDAKNQFIMATQHHLRTPLTSMYGYLDLIRGGSYGKVPKKLEEVLDKFNTCTANEIKIVNDLLDISQFQLGRQVVFPREEVKIEEILKEALADVKLEADKKGIYLKLEFPANLLPIKADPQKLRVALYNIVDNAVKYTQKGGVDIIIEPESETLRIIVKDTGVGISKENQKDLFNKLFERGEGAMQMFATGRGIGLWITSRIIEGHKGKVWAESEGEGKGSKFIIELPIKVGAEGEDIKQGLLKEFRI